MNFLFIHKFFPGQFKYLISRFGSSGEHKLIALAQTRGPESDGMPAEFCDVRLYGLPFVPENKALPHARRIQSDMAQGQALAARLEELRLQGFVPDVIFAHSGWGEALYCKDVFPDIPVVGYFEHFYRSDKSDADFFLRDSPTLEQRLHIRSLNAAQLLQLVDCDAGISPTKWQKDGYPSELQSKLHEIHEGVDTRLFKPNRNATFSLSGGQEISRADEVVTYVSRNLEPYRGFYQFLQSVQILLKRRPRMQVLIAGGDEVSYSPRLPNGQTYREKYCRELDLDLSRVHFLGWVTGARYRQLLQVSSAHVYLTVPFVLSWSMLEAMACGCVVVGSDTAPVAEVIRHGENGLLCDFFSPMEIADTVSNVLDHPTRMEPLARAARETVVSRYDASLGVAKYIRLIESLTGKQISTQKSVAE